MPPDPIIEIEVSGDAVTVDGVVVDRGSAGGPDTTVAMHLGVHAAARLVAQPLGRPVRAVLRCGTDEKRLVIHPDGSVTDVEDTFPVTSLVAPAGSRSAPIQRHARRPHGAALRVRRTRLAVGLAYAAIAVVLAGGIVMELATSDGTAPAPTAEEPPALTEPSIDDPVAPADRAVIKGNKLERLPGIRDVVVNPATGGFQLRLTTGRAARVTVRAAAVSGEGGAWQWALQTAKATTRTLDVDDLEAGAYRYTVQAPGERPLRGSFVIEPPVEPEVVTVGTTPEPQAPSTPDNNNTPPPSNNNNGGGGGGNDGSSLPGPTRAHRPRRPERPMRAARAAGPAFVGLAMVAALVAGTGPSTGSVTSVSDQTGARQDPTPRPVLQWSGYPIARTGKAAGEWIGARRWGRHGPVLYRIDPAASGRSTTYKPGRWVRNGAGEESAFLRQHSYDGPGRLDPGQVRQGAAPRSVGRSRRRRPPPAGRDTAGRCRVTWGGAGSSRARSRRWCAAWLGP